MRLSKSSPALYALKGKHAQCVDSEWNVSGIGLFKCMLISTHNRGSSYLQSSPEYAVIIFGSGPQPAWFLAWILIS